MKQNGIELIVLVNNRAITEYEHNNQIFIEGRGGSNYEIEVRNHTSDRIEAVISVDGLAVTDGKEAGSNSRGYLIERFGSVRIPGWKLDAASAAKFTFAGKEASYATQMSDGKTPNNGVIGVLAYAQKPPVQTYNTSYMDQNLYSASRGIAPSGYGEQKTSGGNLFGTGGWAGSGIPSNNVSVSNSISASASASQTLGTAFGGQTHFATRTVFFERGPMLTVLSVFYDDLKGLRARGVPIRKSRKAKLEAPNAFPGLTGCQPPQGWTG